MKKQWFLMALVAAISCTSSGNNDETGRNTINDVQIATEANDNTTHRLLTHDSSDVQIGKKANDNTTEPLSTYSGLTFRTFTESEYDNNVAFQGRLSDKKISENLKRLGFKLIDTKTESRPDYTGEDFYDVTIETYSKTVNGYVTTVKLESGYTEIHFPNLNDVNEFKKTVRACGLKETNDGFTDSEKIYWAGTDVSIKGTIVTLKYRTEA